MIFKTYHETPLLGSSFTYDDTSFMDLIYLTKISPISILNLKLRMVNCQNCL